VIYFTAVVLLVNVILIISIIGDFERLWVLKFLMHLFSLVIDPFSLPHDTQKHAPDVHLVKFLPCNFYILHSF
jgi:hypothetical protein